MNAYMGNAAEAARAAGYSVKAAKQQGARLLTNANVKKAIAARSAKSEARAIATREERQRFWTQVMHDEYEELAQRLKASELLGKSQADFTEKVEHSGTVSFEQLVTASAAKDGE